MNINLHDKDSVDQIAEKLNKLKRKNSALETLEESIIKAAETIKNYKETLDLSPKQINQVLQNLHINDASSPEEMNANIQSNRKAYVIRRKFLDAHVTRKKFETVLMEIVFELSRSVSGDVLSAIVNLIKNFGIICLEVEEIHTTYKDVCFKFFTKDRETNELLILIININYEDSDKSISFIKKVFHMMLNSVRITFFGAVVKTQLTESRAINK